MALLDNTVFDSGLSVLDTLADILYICDTAPTTYTEASSTYALGNKAAPTVGAPADAGGGGRQVTVSAITDGTVTGTGTAAYWALCDESESALLAAGDLSAGQSVTSGNTFTLTEFTISIPDPA